MLKRSISRMLLYDKDSGEKIVLTPDKETDIQKQLRQSEVETTGYSTDCESGGTSGAFTPTVTLTSESWSQHCSEYVRPILVGYAFGAKKMSTMGMIMAEASMEISTIIHSCDNDEDRPNDIENNEIASSQHHQQPETLKQGSSSIRVSFVPLDLDIPIDEQHGGQFDVILHKLTEDILSSSSTTATAITGKRDSVSAQCRAQQRIESLILYKRARPACCLVDHPNDILPVLGRDRMCNILKSCLLNVKTASGLSVSTPHYLVIKNNINHDCIEEKLSKLPITYPIIVKPLAAAGTVQSHKMLILFAQSALSRICTPVLLQQYTNHDSLLYKVYVLGDAVWVFPRRSLPNLPKGSSYLTNSSHSSYVEFDSQQPYPDLSAFCQPDQNLQHQVHKKHKHNHKKEIVITSQEVQPLVEILRKSFQLELFGFDVLYTGAEIMVVDVNYFPSYKEVQNFPSYLARYLTKRAIDARKKI